MLKSALVIRVSSIDWFKQARGHLLAYIVEIKESRTFPNMGHLVMDLMEILHSYEVIAIEEDRQMLT